MNAKFLSLPLALAAIAGAGSPAISGEWSAAGIADYNRSVAVPAPIPVPVNKAQWYLRTDLGVTAAGEGTLDVTGIPIDTHDVIADRPFSYSFGIGRYFDNSGFRWDISVDFRDYQRVTGSSEHSSSVTGPVAGIHPVSGNVSDDTTTTNTSFYHRGEAELTTTLLSFYYDVDTGTSFTPYIGGGVGLAVHSLRLRNDLDVQCQIVSVDTGAPNPPEPDATTDCSQGENKVTTSRGYGVAAMATAGLSYEIMEGISLDMAYRFLWADGNVALESESPGGFSTITIGERMDHEIRTGVRFDIF